MLPGWLKMKSRPPIFMGRLLGFLLLMTIIAYWCPDLHMPIVNASNVTPTTASDTDLVNKILRDDSSSPFRYTFTPPLTTISAPASQGSVQSVANYSIQINKSRTTPTRRRRGASRKRREVSVVVKNSQKFTDSSSTFLLKTILSETSYNNQYNSSSISTKIKRNYDRLIKVLNLGRQNLHQLPSELSELAHQSDHIDVIDLSGNQLKAIYVAFSLGNRLTFFNCSNNNLTQFELTRLTAPPAHVDLSFNNLGDDGLHIRPSPATSDAGPNANSSHKLTYLDVSFNQFTTVDGTLRHTSPDYLASLKVLNLAYNRLNTIKRKDFARAEKLEILILSHNLITEIENETFSGLANLQYLDLSGNDLNSSSLRVLQGIPDLTGLSLAGNPRLGNALQGFVASWSLKELDVSGTGLCEIPAALVQSVRTLNLADNYFQVIRCGDLDSYPLLYNLILSGCNISDIEEDAMGRLEILAYLNLNDNSLKQIPASLPSRLIALHIENNGIMDLQPSNFKHLTSLRILSLSGNRIKYLPALPLHNLLVLNLISAELHGLSQLVVQTSPYLKDLRLDNNPVKCADLLGIAEWATPCRDVDNNDDEKEPNDNTSDYSDLEDEELQTFISEKSHYNLNVVTEFVQSRVQINDIINRKRSLDKRQYCNKMDSSLVPKLSHLNSAPLVSTQLVASTTTGTSPSGQSSKPIETANKSGRIIKPDNVETMAKPAKKLPVMPPTEIGLLLKTTTTTMSTVDGREDASGGRRPLGNGNDKITPMKQNMAVFVAKVPSATEYLNKNSITTLTTTNATGDPTSGQPSQTIQLGQVDVPVSPAVIPSSQKANSPLAIKSVNSETEKRSKTGMIGSRKKVGYGSGGVNKKLIKLTDSSNKRKAMPFIGDNKRTGDVFIDLPAPISITSSSSSTLSSSSSSFFSSSSLLSTSSSSPFHTTDTTTTRPSLSATSPLFLLSSSSFAQTLPILSSHDNSQINSTDRNYQQIRANNTTDNNESLELSSLPFHTSLANRTDNNGNSVHGDAADAGSANNKSRSGKQRKQGEVASTKELIELKIPITNDDKSSSIGNTHTTDAVLPIVDDDAQITTTSQRNLMANHDDVDDKTESRDNGKHLIRPIQRADNNLQGTLISEFISAGVTNASKSETILINEPASNTSSSSSPTTAKARNKSFNNKGVNKKTKKMSQEQQIPDGVEDVLKLTDVNENGKIYVAENSLNVAELIPESTSSGGVLNQERGQASVLAEHHHQRQQDAETDKSDANSNIMDGGSNSLSIATNGDDNEAKRHETGQTEPWNEVRGGGDGDVNYHQPHPGLFIVIGATIGVVVSIGLFQCKKSWWYYHRSRRRRSMMLSDINHLNHRRLHLDRLASVANVTSTATGDNSIDNYSQFDECDYYYRTGDETAAASCNEADAGSGRGEQADTPDGFENIQLTPKLERRKSVKFDILPMKILASDDQPIHHHNSCALHPNGGNNRTHHHHQQHHHHHHFKGLADSSLDLW